ncbi:MAG: FkbM family methyltransferase [Pseudomonadota bacterium]
MSALNEALLRLVKLYPLYRGRGRLALSSLFRADITGPDGTIEVRLSSGEKIRVVEQDYIGRMVRLFGDLDPALSSVMRGIVGPGDWVIDVGANVGVMTLRAASLVGPAGQVFAFEPVQQLCDLMRRSILDNGFGNVTVLQVALSDHAGTGTMEVPDTYLGCSRLQEAGQGNGQRCEVKRLDDIDFGDAFARPRLLKIDVEGHEGQVLAGGHHFFRAHRPDYVLFESHDDRGEFWKRPEIRLLRDADYEFSVVRRTAFGNPVLTKIRPQDTRFPAAYDFLASSLPRKKRTTP